MEYQNDVTTRNTSSSSSGEDAWWDLAFSDTEEILASPIDVCRTIDDSEDNDLSGYHVYFILDTSGLPRTRDIVDFVSFICRPLRRYCCELTLLAGWVLHVLIILILTAVEHKQQNNKT